MNQSIQHLYVTSQTDEAVLRYSLTTPQAQVFASQGGLNSPSSLVFGPDENLYVGNFGDNSIVRFKGDSGIPLGVFVPAGSGGMLSPETLIFHKGFLYVCSFGSPGISDGMVLRYDASNGSFLSEFVPAGVGGLVNASDMTFGPDGNLYVVNFNNLTGDPVLRYDGTTGSFLGAFVSAGSGGINTPMALAFGPDKNLYVSSLSTDGTLILRYDGKTGVFLDQFTIPGSGGLILTEAMKFAPHGDLFVSTPETAALNEQQSMILQYGRTGACLGVFVAGLNSAKDLVFWH